MCAVIGVILKSPTRSDFEMIRRLFIESKIRGMHATGMSFLPHWSDKVITIKEAVPADRFAETHLHVDNMQDLLNEDGNLYLIGHCRYSTSDLEYNQPIANDQHSVVHNGVITQELPERWKMLYGYDFETKNDSELVLKSESPLEQFPDASAAVCELFIDKKLLFYRNGKRPLYLTNVENGSIITSTSDIPKRANVFGIPVDVPMNTYITFDSELAMHMEKIQNTNSDLQKVNYVRQE